MKTCSNCRYCTMLLASSMDDIRETEVIYRCDDTYEEMPQCIADNTYCDKWNKKIKRAE